MSGNPKDIIWEQTYGLYYDTYYDEMLATNLVVKWMSIDFVLKIVIASAAFLSAASGLILWGSQAGKPYWFMLSVIIVILTVIYLILNINQKIIQLTRVHKEFLALRHVIESFRNHMDVNAEFNVSQYRTQLKTYEDTYVDICRHNPHDILASSDLIRSTQNEVSKKLSRITQKHGERIKPRNVSVDGIIRGAPFSKPPLKSRQHKYSG